MCKLFFLHYFLLACLFDCGTPLPRLGSGHLCCSSCARVLLGTFSSLHSRSSTYRATVCFTLGLTLCNRGTCPCSWLLATPASHGTIHTLFIVEESGIVQQQRPGGDCGCNTLTCLFCVCTCASLFKKRCIYFYFLYLDGLPAGLYMDR